MTYLKGETTTINVTLMVPIGDSCLIRTDMHRGHCHHYRSKACHVFNKTIIDGKKRKECIEATV
jgi:hypothetical protein